MARQDCDASLRAACIPNAIFQTPKYIKKYSYFNATDLHRLAKTVAVDPIQNKNHAE
jgi:hypothetical protein